MDLLCDIETASVKELRYFTGVSMSVIDTLIEKNVLISFERQIFRSPYKTNVTPMPVPIVLTNEYVEEIRNNLPELPDKKKARYLDEFGLTDYDATCGTDVVIPNQIDAKDVKTIDEK